MATEAKSEEKAPKRKHPWSGVCTCKQAADGSIEPSADCPLHGTLRKTGKGGVVERVDRAAAGGANPEGWRDRTGDKDYR